MKACVIHDGYHSRGQNKRRRAHPEYDKHVEAIEQCREYLAEARFSQWDNVRHVTSYGDQLKSHISMAREANQSKVVYVLPSDS